MRQSTGLLMNHDYFEILKLSMFIYIYIYILCTYVCMFGGCVCVCVCECEEVNFFVSLSGVKWKGNHRYFIWVESLNISKPKINRSWDFQVSVITEKYNLGLGYIYRMFCVPQKDCEVKQSKIPSYLKPSTLTASVDLLWPPISRQKDTVVYFYFLETLKKIVLLITCKYLFGIRIFEYREKSADIS